MKMKGKVFIYGFILAVAFSLVTVSCTEFFKLSDEEKVAIDAKSHVHTFSSEWMSDETYHWHEAVCSHKSEISDKAEHNWNDGDVTTSATTTSDGVKTYKCTVCQRIQKTEGIESLSVTLTFNLDGGTGTESITGKYGESITAPADPKKEAHLFKGWIPSLPDTFPAENTTYTAKWEACRHTITGRNSDGDFFCGICDYVFLKTSEVTVIPEDTNDTKWTNWIEYDYAIGRYEVTQELFEAVMGGNPSKCIKENPDFANMVEGERQKLRPVENINPVYAMIFCNKLSVLEGLEPCYNLEFSESIEDFEIKSNNYSKSVSYSAGRTMYGNMTYIPKGIGGVLFNCPVSTKNGYRLPTVAEWEYVATAGKTEGSDLVYKYENVDTVDDLKDYEWYDENSANKSVGNAYYGTHEVGTKLPNLFGVYDINGNVREIADLTTGYGFTYVLGGAWEQSASLYLKDNCYQYDLPIGDEDSIIDSVGFRIVRSINTNP